jgi:hypothetical protein
MNPKKSFANSFKNFPMERRVPLKFIYCPFQILMTKKRDIQPLNNDIDRKNEIRKNEKIEIKISTKLEQKSL